MLTTSWQHGARPPNTSVYILEFRGSPNPTIDLLTFCISRCGKSSYFAEICTTSNVRNEKRFAHSNQLPATLPHLSTKADNCAIRHEGAGWEGRRVDTETNILDHLDDS